jgi:hypothetical protein
MSQSGQRRFMCKNFAALSGPSVVKHFPRVLGGAGAQGAGAAAHTSKVGK